MWPTLSLCLLSLVLTSEWVSGDRQRLHHKSSSEGPKERRIDKMPPCVHDEVLYVQCVVMMRVRALVNYSTRSSQQS